MKTSTNQRSAQADATLKIILPPLTLPNGTAIKDTGNISKTIAANKVVAYTK
jgi:hypothetical protein